MVAALLAAMPLSLAAQRDVNDADAREVRAYTLTMPKLRQLNQVMLDLKKQQEADPAYRALQQKKKELAALERKDEPTEAEEERMARLGEEIAAAEEAEEDEEDDGPKSLSELAQRMAGDPRIAGPLKRAGLAPREAAVMQFALLQAGFTASMLESGTIKQIPKEANAANVRFYQANKAELQGLAGLVAENDE
jgi:hypothetical protein